jgi:hypothetical protein
MRLDILKREEEIRIWVTQKKSKSFICKELDCKQATLNSYLEKFQLEYKGNQGGSGKKSNTRKTAEELSRSSFVTSHKLKLRLLEDGVKEHRCERCLLEFWLGVPIPLELHHKDGNRFNNSLSNVELLCPNCHALEPNNSGKAIKKDLPM